MACLRFVILLVALAAPLHGMIMPVQMFKTCLSTVKIECPCGKNGNAVKVQIEECLVVDAAMHPGVVSRCQSCTMRDSNYDPCESFASCEKCDPNGQGCTSCPPGLSGKYCDKRSGDDYYGEFYPGQFAPGSAVRRGKGNEIEDEEFSPLSIGQEMMRDHLLHYEQKRSAVYPIEIFIPPGGTNDPKARLVRAVTSCPFPDYLETAELRCAIWPTYSKCNMTCIWGHVLSTGGRSLTMKCRNKENTWKPEGFRECIPYVDCSVQLVSPGALSCISNRVADPNDCEITCDEYDDIPEIPKKTYTCNLQGTFDPPLPFCAVKANSTTTAKPPTS